MKIVSMDDTGTRVEHLTDLYDLWSAGVGILSRGTYHSKFEKELIAELEICLKHLHAHMTKDVRLTEYAKIINNLGTLPPAPEIPTKE